jgi:hypothetical protein
MPPLEKVPAAHLSPLRAATVRGCAARVGPSMGKPLPPLSFSQAPKASSTCSLVRSPGAAERQLRRKGRGGKRREAVRNGSCQGRSHWAGPTMQCFPHPVSMSSAIPVEAASSCACCRRLSGLTATLGLLASCRGHEEWRKEERVGQGRGGWVEGPARGRQGARAALTWGNTVSSSSRQGSAASGGTCCSLVPNQRTAPPSPHSAAGTCTDMDASARHSCVRTGGAPLQAGKARVEAESKGGMRCGRHMPEGIGSPAEGPCMQ